MDEMTLEMVISICDDEFYRNKRFNVPFSMILIDCDNDETFKILEKNIRQIDIMQRITKSRTIICLTHTANDKALLFIEKIKTKIKCKSELRFIAKEYSGEDKIEFVTHLFSEYDTLF